MKIKMTKKQFIYELNKKINSNLEYTKKLKLDIHLFKLKLQK